VLSFNSSRVPAPAPRTIWDCPGGRALSWRTIEQDRGVVAQIPDLDLGARVPLLQEARGLDRSFAKVAVRTDDACRS